MSSTIVDHHARRFPTPPDDGGMILLVLLVKRVEGTYKAYAAIVPDTSRTDPAYTAYQEFIMSRGNPLRFEEAVILWPSLKGEGYAR